jgi:hypothetical protein
MGYEVNRFQGEVDEELICPICSSVLEEPLQVIYICMKSLKIPKGGNQNPSIEQGQTTKWPKEKGQNDKQ